MFTIYNLQSAGCLRNEVTVNTCTCTYSAAGLWRVAAALAAVRLERNTEQVRSATTLAECCLPIEKKRVR